MGSDIALAVVGKIVENTVDPIVNTIVHQFSYLFRYKQNIQALLSELDELEASRDGVQLQTDEAERNLEIVDPAVKLWLTNVDDIKSKAMAVREGTSNVEKGCLNGWCPNLKHRYLLSRKATKLRAGIGKLRVKGDKNAQFSHSALPMGIVPSISPKADDFKGFATRIATMNKLMDALKDDDVHLIGISGMGGIGKTTLVNQVLKNMNAESLFKEVAKVVVSQQPDVIKVQGEIAIMLGLKFKGDPDTVLRAGQLCERLKKGGKVLVVLDDIWEPINLDEVGIPAGKGCKVVFTTRIVRTCTEMEVHKHIELELLADQEAWNLFREAAGECVENEDLRATAKEVAQECGGLPIAIVTLGKALSKRKKYEWEDARLKLKKSTGMDQKVQSSIRLSYDFLKSHSPESQPLLLLCTLFQEDETIPIEWLVKYSMGLDRFSEDVETLEETRNRVYTLVENLKLCNLLLQGDGEYADSCVKLHDVVRDVCMSITSNPPHAYLVRHARELKKWPQHNRHGTDHTAIALMSHAMKELPGHLDYPNLRLLQLQLQLKCQNIDIDEEFFEKMRGLQVFNFVGGRYEYGWSSYSSYYVSRCNVLLPPKVFQNLTNLQTLSLEFCNLGGDLSSIGCLKGLKILSFYESRLGEFPREVGELKNLKSLDLRFDYEYFSQNIECSLLSGLDQLEALYLGEYSFSKSIKDLNSLSCLTTLQICVYNSKILLELEQPLFEKLEKFDIYIDNRASSCRQYGIIRNVINVGKDDLSWILHTKLRSLLRKNQSFSLGWSDADRFMLDHRDSGFCALYDLEFLNIYKMDNLREISPESKIPQGSFRRLQELRLSFLPALKHLWRGPAQPPSLANLRLIEIEYCDSIDSLFPSNVAKCMLQLEHLKIQGCKKLKGVVSNQGKEGDADDKGLEQIEFPKLQSIHLRYLRDFKSLYPDQSRTIQTLFNQWVSFPRLEEIVLSNDVRIEGIVGHQIQDGFIPDGIRGFRNLTTLDLDYCHGLRYLMPYSVAKMLVNLKVLKLRWCDKIVVVIEVEDEEESSSEARFNECIVFPQLQDLVLDHLPEFISFCSNKCSLEFPLLKNVVIQECQKMKNFCGGEVNAPVLKEPVEGPKRWQWIWEGNLNNGKYIENS